MRRATYDAEANAWYVYLTDAPIVRQQRLSDDVILDVDAEGNVVGVEVLGGMREAPASGNGAATFVAAGGEPS